jgi:GAF domain-containing protein
MKQHPNLTLKLLDLSHLLEMQNNLEEGLRQVASMTAEMLKTQRCSIMLLSEPEPDEQTSGEHQGCLRVVTHYGNLPQSAYQEAIQLNNGIAGYVAATGKSLLIQDITQSPFLESARFLKGKNQGDESNNSFMSVPILLSDQIIGVINVSNPDDKCVFEDLDLELLKIFAVFVGKSIHIAQLQTILKSRFVEMAVISELRETESQGLFSSVPNPSKLAKIVAKSFFKELTKAGFGPNQVIEIATEVLNLLQSSLDKYKKRLIRDE